MAKLRDLREFWLDAPLSSNGSIFSGLIWAVITLKHDRPTLLRKSRCVWSRRLSLFDVPTSKPSLTFEWIWVVSDLQPGTRPPAKRLNREPRYKIRMRFHLENSTKQAYISSYKNQDSDIMWLSVGYSRERTIDLGLWICRNQRQNH